MTIGQAVHHRSGVILETICFGGPYDGKVKSAALGPNTQVFEAIVVDERRQSVTRGIYIPQRLGYCVYSEPDPQGHQLVVRSGVGYVYRWQDYPEEWIVAQWQLLIALVNGGVR